MKISNLTNSISSIFINKNTTKNNMSLRKIDNDSFVKTNDVSFKGITGYERIFMMQVYCENVDAVKNLSKNPHLDMNAKDEHGQTALHIASYKGNTEILKSILDRGDINVNSKANNGSTPLHYAINQVHKDAVAMLVEHKDIDVNSQGEYKCTPLHTAILLGEPELVKILLKHKNIDLSIKNESGETALDIAKSKCFKLNNAEENKNNKEILKLLHEKMFKIKQQNCETITNNDAHSRRRRNIQRQPRFTIRR